MTRKKTQSVTNQEKRVRDNLDPIQIDSRRRRRQRWLGQSRLEGFPINFSVFWVRKKKEEEKKCWRGRREENGSIDRNDDDVEELWRFVFV